MGMRRGERDAQARVIFGNGGRANGLQEKAMFEHFLADNLRGFGFFSGDKLDRGGRVGGEWSILEEGV